MGEDARLEDRLVVLASGFVGLAGACLAVPLVEGRGAALAGTVPAGPTEEALVDRRRGGWLDMSEMVRFKFQLERRSALQHHVIIASVAWSMSTATLSHASLPTSSYKRSTTQIHRV